MPRNRNGRDIRPRYKMSPHTEFAVALNGRVVYSYSLLGQLFFLVNNHSQASWANLSLLPCHETTIQLSEPKLHSGPHLSFLMAGVTCCLCQSQIHRRYSVAANFHKYVLPMVRVDCSDLIGGDNKPTKTWLNPPFFLLFS